LGGNFNISFLLLLYKLDLISLFFGGGRVGGAGGDSTKKKLENFDEKRNSNPLKSISK
jgi:hypothetical protein